jgi:hypothetical protein
MEDIKVHYMRDPDLVVIETPGGLLQLELDEAANLFVDLGHVLQDLNVMKEEDNDGSTN